MRSSIKAIILGIIPLLLVGIILSNPYIIAVALILLIPLYFHGREDSTIMEILLSIPAAILVFYLVFPIVALMVHIPDGIESTDPTLLKAIETSIYAGLVACAISLIFAIPLAYSLVRGDFPGRGIIEAIVDIPVVVPHTVAGIALIVVFSTPPLDSTRIIDSFWGIVAAMTFVSAPFMVNQIKESIRAVDQRIEAVARTLGAPERDIFFRVLLPMIMPGIITGFLMAFARAMSEFGAVVMIAYYPKTAPVLIYERFISSGLVYSSGSAAVFLLVVLVIFTILRIICRVMDNDKN